MCAKQALDVPHVLLLVGRREGDREALGARTAGTTNAVHVILGLLRHVVVDDQRDVLDVDTARGNVGGHQHAVLTALEAVERRPALGERAVGV